MVILNQVYSMHLKLSLPTFKSLAKELNDFEVILPEWKPGIENSSLQKEEEKKLLC